MTAANSIVLIEDSDADARIVIRAVEKHALNVDVVHLKSVTHGTEYFKAHPTVDGRRIVFLDLNLPGADGFQFLKFLKSDPELMLTPVIVWSTSDQRADVRKSYEHGVNSFIIKPMGLVQSTAMVTDVCNYWFGHVTVP